MLPADFPNWRTCYKYFRWSERPGPGQDSILEVQRRLGAARQRKEQTSFCIVDSQSVKGKKVSGIKRHMRWTRKDCPMRYRDYRRRYRPGRGFGDV